MTLPLEVVTHIRRLHYAEHWKVGTIATELKVHHEAVERALGLDTRAGMGVKRVLPTLLDAYTRKFGFPWIFHPDIIRCKAGY